MTPTNGDAAGSAPAAPENSKRCQHCSGSTRPPDAPLSQEAIRLFPRFVGDVARRLELGAAVYGDLSFTRPPADVIGELEEEALDLAGWGFVLWCRLRAMRMRVTP